MNNKAIHMLLIHHFAVLRTSIPGLPQKLTSSSVTYTVANVISGRQYDVSLCPGSGIFKAITWLSTPWQVQENFLKYFYAIIAIKHVTSAGPHGFQHLPRGPSRWAASWQKQQCGCAPSEDRSEGLDGGVMNSQISKNLTHYSLSLKCLLIL